MSTSNDDDLIQIPANGPLKIGPPMVTLQSTHIGRVDIVDPIAVDASLNVATCEDDDCDCGSDGQPVYLVMIEVEVTKQEFDRLSEQPGWFDDDEDEQ